MVKCETIIISYALSWSLFTKQIFDQYLFGFLKFFFSKILINILYKQNNL